MTRVLSHFFLHKCKVFTPLVFKILGLQVSAITESYLNRGLKLLPIAYSLLPFPTAPI
ncbi:hypothetical protein MC7420_6467 [Coleofasciculus chthonoplastes PCC 7420]|uniref:Uncharacterized protein n=1 Tax=Coleofasciculus chthonoplastes PCC 7420 TaxID=118168 RepID=B4VQY6_9CYAN|nr:hypothetical protein MC7420_6467 [Coleofasciculus chthonoplastes PCC 7420]